MEWFRQILFLAPLMGTVAIAIGLFAILSPQKASKSYGLAISGSGLPYVQATGARDVFLGIMIILASVSDFRFLIYTLLSITVVSSFDFFVTWKYGNRRYSMIHLGATVGIVLYVGLLMWLTSQK